MTLQSTSHIDVIFKRLGAHGQFTIRQMLCLAIGAFPCGFQVLSNVFIGQAVSHRCAPPSNESDILSKYSDNSNAILIYEQCKIVVSSNNTVLEKMDCVYGMEYDRPRDASVISEFDLVCSRSPLFHLTQTLLIGGQGVGVVLATFLADRFGRKYVTVGANFGLLVSGMMIAFTPNYCLFAVSKFLAGASQQAYLSCSMTLFLEMLTMKNRRWSTALEGVKWIMSIMTLSLVAFLLRHQSWRTLQLALSLSALSVFFQLWYVQESLRWLAANGKTQKAKKYIEYAARLNGKKYEYIIQAYEDNSEDTTENENVEIEEEMDKTKPLQQDDTMIHFRTTRKLSAIDIFKVKNLFINCVVMWSAWFTGILGFFTLYLISSPLAGDTYLNFFLMILTEVPAHAFLFLTMNRLGRKWALIILFSLLSFGLISSGVLRSRTESVETSVLALLCSLVAVFGASGTMRLLYSYTLELFPTNIRNQALGIASLLGRIGGMIAPFMNVLIEEAKWAPGILIGCLSFIVAILLKFLPETNGRELPQTLEELHEWRREETPSKKNTDFQTTNSVKVDIKLVLEKGCE